MRPRSTIAPEEREEDDDDPLSELRRRGTNDRNHVARLSRPYFTEGVSLCSFDLPTWPEEEEFLVNLRV